MKINNVKALDYQETGDGKLAVLLQTDDLEGVKVAITGDLAVETDAGDLVEVLTGYTLQALIYTPAMGVVKAELAREEVSELEQLRRRLDELEAQTVWTALNTDTLLPEDEDEEPAGDGEEEEE